MIKVNSILPKSNRYVYQTLKLQEKSILKKKNKFFIQSHNWGFQMSIKTCMLDLLAIFGKLNKGNCNFLKNKILRMFCHT